MSDALREQLLKAGLVDEERLEQARNERGGGKGGGKRGAKRDARGGKRKGRGKGRSGKADARGGGQRRGGDGAGGSGSGAPQRGARTGDAPRSAFEAHEAREREAARRRRLKEERQALKAQVTRIIDANRVKREDGEIGYSFREGKKIKRIWVTEAQRDALARGELAIVRDGTRYEAVPTDVAEKLKLHDPNCVIAVHDPGAEDEAAYPDHPVPDDLDW